MKTFTLTVTEQDLQVLSIAIGEVPYKMAAPLLSRIQPQIDEQSAPPAEPKEPAKAKPKS